MDFRSQVLAASGLAGVVADALMLVVVGNAVPAGLEKPLSSLLDDAVKQGDLEFKAGRALYLHRPAGVKAPRVVFAVATDSTPKAFKTAVAAGLSSLKAQGAKHLAVALVGSDALADTHAEALV